MAALKMMQGDTYPVFIELKIDETGLLITPDMVSEVEVCVGESIRKTYSSGEVYFDTLERKWYFIPSQSETFSLEPDSYEVQVRPKFANGDYSQVKGVRVGFIIIEDANSNEVI